MKVTTIENIATGKVHTGGIANYQAFTACGTSLSMLEVLIKQYIIQPGFSVIELLTCQRCKAIAIKQRENHNGT